MKHIKHADRTKAALKVIKHHFSGCESKISDEDMADLMAFHYGAWTKLEPVQSFRQKDTLRKITKDLKDLDNKNDTPIWMSAEIRKIHKKLDEMAEYQTLHGKQNTSPYREKLCLIDTCIQTWKHYKGTSPPKTFQGETHQYTLFVTDVLQEVFEYDFSPRSAIEAHITRK